MARDDCVASPRHCEELLRRSNPAFLRCSGLPRFARNDVESSFEMAAVIVLHRLNVIATSVGM
jgi:hypothetical protein